MKKKLDPYEAFTTCCTCGGAMQRVSEENASPLVMECRSCAHREYAEIQISPDGFFDDKEIVYRRVVVCRGKAKARAGEVRALRKLHAKFAALPMSEAARRIGASRCIDLGVYPLEKAQGLLDKAAAHGLQALLEQPEERCITDQGTHQFFEPFGAPVSVDRPGEESSIIPFGWILIAAVLLLTLLVWILR